MSLARDIAKSEGSLRGKKVSSAFLPDGDGLAPGPTPDSAALAGRVAQIMALGPESVLKLCRQVLQVQYSELAPRLIDAEFVATLPSSLPGDARPTLRVLTEMISEGNEEVIALGYEFSDGEILQLLHEASARGVQVVIIGDRSRGSLARVSQSWPVGVQKPKLFHDRERGTRRARYASMHAKCLLVDGRSLLITSANFTFHGLRGNIEFGVRLSGEPAQEARRIFSRLVNAHILEKCV